MAKEVTGTPRAAATWATRLNRNMNCVWVLMAGVVLLTAAVPISCLGQETGSLKITVTDSMGHLLAHAQVHVTGRKDANAATEPDSDDAAIVVNHLPPGKYRVTAKAPHMRDGISPSVIVEEGKITGLTVQLDPAPPSPLDIHTHQTPDPDMVSVYSKFLQAVNEPELCTKPTTERIHSYRVLWLPTWDHPVFVRIEVQEDGTATLHVKTLSGQGGYGLGSLQTDITRKLSFDEEGDLFGTLADIDFWHLPTRVEDSDKMVLDGVIWVIEGVRDGNCHLVGRISSPLTDIVSRYLLGDVAKLKPYYKDAR
jgi:hypothetical protein